MSHVSEINIFVCLYGFKTLINNDIVYLPKDLKYQTIFPDILT